MIMEFLLWAALTVFALMLGSKVFADGHRVSAAIFFTIAFIAMLFLGHTVVLSWNPITAGLK